MLIGAHTSSAGGPAKAIERAEKMGAQVVQVFTQSPRAWRPTPISDDQAAKCRLALCESETVERIYCHATYLINLASPEKELFKRSVECFASNLLACESITSSGLIFHPGSHRASGLEAGLASIAQGIASAVEIASRDFGKNFRTSVLFENTAGAGDTIGRTFEDLAQLIERTESILAGKYSINFGVCIDTQHLWASGIDYSSASKVESVIAQFDSVIGLGRLKAIHLNDSKVALGSNRDRHANLGVGSIGADCLGLLIAHNAFNAADCILEVPGPNGKGPEAIDIEQARKIYSDGLKVWESNH